MSSKDYTIQCYSCEKHINNRDCVKEYHTGYMYCSVNCMDKGRGGTRMATKEELESVGIYEKASSIQEGGSHYKKYSIEPIDFITANNLSYIQGNVIKYIVRYKDKNGLEDLKKAKHYIDLLIELEYKENKNVFI